MSQRDLHAVLALAGICLLAARGLAQEAAVTVEVDATVPGPVLRQIWAYFGYDEANYTTHPESRELLRTLTTMHEAPVRVRTHFLFNTGDGTPALKWGSTNLYTEDDSGAPVYDFTIIDQIVDATVGAGAVPLFELGFMPQALSTQPEPYEPSGTYVLDGGSFYPPRDYEKWAALVTAWAEHAQARYADSQGSWLWELWNEPDIGYWQGTPEEYARLYDVTEAALHAVLPDAPLGAPAVSSPEAPFLADFLEHCESGDNAVTGQTGTRLDFVTFHAKGGVRMGDDYFEMDLGNQLRLHRTGFEAVAASAFAETPVVVSEADPDGCAACPDPSSRQLVYRNSPAYGAYEVATMKRSLDLAEELGVDLRGVLTWAFTFPESPYFMGYRELATNGIHLPVLGAFKLLAQLRGARLTALSSGALPLGELLAEGVRQGPDIDVLASAQGDQVRVLIWNYHDLLAPAEDAEVTLKVDLPASFGDRVSLTHERVDETHGNAFTVWEAQGRPSAPSADQLEELEAAMNALVLEPEREVEVEGGSVVVSFGLPRFGVSLLTLTQSPATEPPTSPGESAGCACAVSSWSSKSSPLLLTLVLTAVLTYGRRRVGTRSVFS